MHFDSEEDNKLSRLVSHYRSEAKRLEVQLHDSKEKYNKDVAKLKAAVQLEKKKRTQVYEEKIDRTNQLMQDINEKTQEIFSL